jgi:hypothetical protein
MMLKEKTWGFKKILLTINPAIMKSTDSLQQQAKDIQELLMHLIDEQKPKYSLMKTTSFSLWSNEPKTTLNMGDEN